MCDSGYINYYTLSKGGQEHPTPLARIIRHFILSSPFSLFRNSNSQQLHSRDSTSHRHAPWSPHLPSTQILVRKPDPAPAEVKRHEDGLEHHVAQDGGLEAGGALQAAPAGRRVAVDGPVAEVRAGHGDDVLGARQLEVEARKRAAGVAGEGVGAGEARVDARPGHGGPVHGGERARQEQQGGAGVDGGGEGLVPPHVAAAVPRREVEPDVPLRAGGVAVQPGDVVGGEAGVDVAEVDAARGVAAQVDGEDGVRQLRLEAVHERLLRGLDGVGEALGQAHDAGEAGLCFESVCDGLGRLHKGLLDFEAPETHGVPVYYSTCR